MVEKILTEIYRLKKDLEGYSAVEALDYIESYINILQREQPSLPPNLDEAAKEYAYNNWEDNDYHAGASEGLTFDAIGHTEKCFKAGAEWMAQQEQPEGLHFTPLNRLIQKIPSKNWNDTVNGYAKKLRDCLIKEGYRKDAEVLQGYISYMNGNNVPMATMDEQEQLEVDLEKFISDFIDKKDSENQGKWCEEDIIEAMKSSFALGLNAGKEGNK